MIQTSFTKVKINEVIQGQIPDAIDNDNPLFGEFLKQYYISQEYQGGAVDIADNLAEYKGLNFLNNENLTGFTSVSSYINKRDSTINVDSTTGWPNQWGLLKINDEIVTYTGITTNSFTGCVRGFSGIENNAKTNAPEYLTFTNSGVGTHPVDARVTNLSNVFLKEFRRKLKRQVLPGFAERNLDEDLDQTNFIRQAKDFYKSKGTEEAFKILFGALYGSPVEMIQPSKFLVRPSDADYIVNDVLICELLTGDPLKITGQSLIQDTTPLETSGSIYNVERAVIGDKSYYKISISRGTTIGKFQQAGKSFLTKSSPIGATILNVDSTVGFGTSGSVIFEDRSIDYTGKNYTQFTGVTLTAPCGIGSTVRSGLQAYSYEDGDLSKKVSFYVLGVLNKFVGEAINQQKDSNINVKTLGKPKEQLNWTTWIYNTASTYNVNGYSLVSPNNYNFDLDADHELYVGDELEVIDVDGNVLDGTLTFVWDALPKRITVNCPTIGASPSYKIRRKLKLSADGYTADVQNTYSKDHTLYVASNSFPHWTIDPQKRIRSFDNIGLSTTTVEIEITDHNLHDGDLVVYSPSTGIGTLTNLNSSQPYYIKKINDNVVKLSYTAENVRRGQFITAFIGNDLAGVSTHFLTPFEVSGTSLGPQKLLKKFNEPEFSSDKIKTVQGAVGLFVNGVEAQSYKSTDIIYYGPIESVDVLNTGSGYDVVNPPRIAVTQSGHTGIGASVIAQVEGTLHEVLVDTEGVDYDAEPTVRIIGGNNTTARLRAKMKFTQQIVEFDSTSTGGVVNTATDRFIFAEPHGFKDGEEIIYDSNGSTTIGIGITPGNLVDTAPYYVVKLDDFQIHISESKTKALAGIGTIDLTTNGGGLQYFKTTDRRNKVDTIEIENAGYFKNREVTTDTVGVNTYTNRITIKDHGFETDEVIKYSASSQGGNPNSAIGGLTSGNEYYIKKLTDDEFRIQTSVGATTFVEFTNPGLGIHIFQDPLISIEIDGRQGITTSNATATPIIRGDIKAVHVKEKGSEFGSTVINDNNKPFIEAVEGKNAFLQPFIVNGRIDQILVLGGSTGGGSEFWSTPDVTIIGDGVGAKAKAIISNGKITGISMIAKGAGYTQAKTTVSAKTPGADAIFSSNLKQWTVNQVDRYARYGDVKDDDGFYGVVKDSDLGNPYINYYVPRNLRNFLGDSGQDHSPIIGWAYDGHPIYGPYGVVDGQLKYIESGYIKITSQRIDGPSITKYPAGFFCEDYVYVDGVGDLDEHNGRFAATPEYPNGVYAYYTTTESSIVNNPTSPFNGVRPPVFPYIIGDSFYSKPESFNTDFDSDQDLDPVKLDLVRNTKPYNIPEYEFITNSNKNTNINSKILTVRKGEIERLDLLVSGTDYNVADKLTFSNTGTGGGGALAKVSQVEGPGITTFTSAITVVDNVTLVVEGQTVTGIATFPHLLPDKANVEILGLSTTTHWPLKTQTKIEVKEVSTGLGQTMTTAALSGLTTSVQITDWMTSGIYKFRVNDYVKIDDEELKIFNFDTPNNRMEMFRGQNGTIAGFHTAGSKITKFQTEFTYQLDNPINLSTPKDIEFYFDAESYVGYGLTFGVGIGTTVSVMKQGGNQTTAWPDAQYKDKFIPTRTVYLPGHEFKHGEKVLYSPGAGSSMSYQTDAMKRVNANFIRPLPPELYVQVISNELVGIVTTQSGIGSDLQRVMIAGGVSIGNTHSFRSQRGEITSQVRIVQVTATTSENHTFEKGDQIDFSVVSTGTSSVEAKYDPGTRMVSLGKPSSNSSLWTQNPPFKQSRGDTLEIDTSDVSLKNTKLEFFLDPDYNKSYVGSGVSAIEIQKTGIPGNASSKTSVKFTEEVPDVLYYRFLPLQNTKEIEVNTDVRDYSKIVVEDSKFNGTHGITTTTANTFVFNIRQLPERVGYSSASEIKYTTTSPTVKGPIGKVVITSGGYDYLDIPEVSVASTTGSGAGLKAFGSDIGAIDKVQMVDFGYDYPSDSTLQPQAEVPQALFLKDNFSVDSVAITSTGKNYLSAPNFVIYNSKTDTVNRDARFDAQLTGGSISGMKVITKGGSLSSGDNNLIPIDNTNGVGIVSCTYSDPTVTLRLQTPTTGFTTANPLPFAVGDKVFVENTGVSTGFGYNSEDHGYKFFTLTGVNTAIGNANGATITYDVTKNPGTHDYQKYGTVSNDKDLAKFKLNLVESEFLNGEDVISSSGAQAIVVQGEGKTKNVLRINTLVGFSTGDTIKGKYSSAGGTIESTKEYSGYFALDTSTEKPFGWEKDTGKLSDFYQRIQDNDYYQNFAYSLKSFVGIASWSEPVDSLAHIAGFKKHSDLLINSTPLGIGVTRYGDNSPPPIGISSGAGGVVLIDADASLYDKHQYDLVTENTNQEQTISDEVTFLSGRFGDAIICNTNRVLDIDDLSPQFYTDPNLVRSVELDTFDMLTGGPGADGINAVKYYAQVVLDVSAGISFNATQYSEFVVFHDGTNAYLNTYSELSDASDLGEFEVTTAGPLASVLFVPNNSAYSYDITFHKEIITNAVGIATTSFGLVEMTGKTTQLVVYGSLVNQDLYQIDATKYKSGTILVSARAPGQEREIDEFTWLANGSGSVLYTNYGLMDSDTDCGTFNLNMVSNNLKLRHTPPIGVAVTISTLMHNVGVAQTVSGTGITGVYEVGDTALSSRYTTIASASTPTHTIISQKSYSNYTTCKYHVEVHNTTDGKYSAFAVSSNTYADNATYNKYNNLSTHVGEERRDIGAVDVYLASGETQLRFLPRANKAYIVRVSEMRIDKPDQVPADVTYTL